MPEIEATSVADSRIEESSVGEPGLDEWSDLGLCAGGDELAFERLVHKHERRLYQLCWRLLGDAGEAEEATQEVFLTLYRKAASFEPRGQLYTLLYRIATNHCLNRLRRRRIVRFLSLSEATGEREGDFQPEDPAPSPSDRFEAAQRWSRTSRAMSLLPAGQRAVLVLVKIEGLSYKEAAEALGTTVGAVESRLFRAVRRLEKELGVVGGKGVGGR